jgi:hypothetical protein
VRGGQQPRQRPGSRSRNGLAATIGPLAVGVLLAFGWNILVSQPHGAAGAESGITRQVGRTVEEVAAKAWASATPHAVTDSARVPARRGHGHSELPRDPAR